MLNLLQKISLDLVISVTHLDYCSSTPIPHEKGLTVCSQ